MVNKIYENCISKGEKLMKTSKVLFGLALALGITASAFASTVDVSPVDKKSSEDKDGKIYASGSGFGSGYFWTNLGYAQITDSNGKPVDLYTPLYLSY